MHKVCLARLVFFLISASYSASAKNDTKVQYYRLCTSPISKSSAAAPGSDVAFFSNGQALCNSQFCSNGDKAAEVGTTFGGFQIVCISDIGQDTDNDGIPDTDDNDLDGDGTENDQDDDLDGDGTPNDQDDDRDGDGKPNKDDKTPDKSDPVKKASASGSCSVAPQCKGDSIQCAILTQTWRNAEAKPIENPDWAYHLHLIA